MFFFFCVWFFFFQAEDGIRDLVRSRGLGDVYKRQHSNNILPFENFEPLESWGRNFEAGCYVFRPSTANDIIGIFEYADFLGVTIGMRGAGRSYGDASINSENILLDLSRFNKILDWNPDIGIIKVESGVTIKQLWEYIIDDGCLLYTSDAADERSSVDLGGRRNIKNKKKKKKQKNKEKQEQ